MSNAPQQSVEAEKLHNNSPYSIQFNPKESLIKQATTATIKSSLSKNLFRVAKWSSDGTSILTEAEDRHIRLFDGSSSDLPDRQAFDHAGSWSTIGDFPMADALLSTCWFPYASANDPSRYCFVTAVKDHPIQLLDASDGRIRASYPIVDHRERMVAPHSMVFSADGSTLFAGYDSAIEIFDVSRSGEPGKRYKTIVSKKCQDGQKGIISTLAVEPSKLGLLAAGSYSGQIAIHDDNFNDLRPVIVFNTSETSGVTQVKFHPQNNQVMFSVSRKSNQILCWDLRYGATSFHSLFRPGRTNQKIQFDIDYTGANLITGGTDGKIRLYSLADINQPAQVFQIDGDTIGSACFNPAACIIVACTGSRRTMPIPKQDQPAPTQNSGNTHSAINSSRTSKLKLWKFRYC